jgi:hypothetical protein
MVSSDNDTSCRLPMNRAGVASHNTIGESQRHVQTRSSCQAKTQVGEKGFDLGSAHFGRVMYAVEMDEASDPADVGLLDVIGVVFETDRITNLIQQPFGAMLLQWVDSAV